MNFMLDEEKSFIEEDNEYDDMDEDEELGEDENSSDIIIG